MSRKRLINQLKEKNSNINVSYLENVVDIFSESITLALMKKKKIEIRGFGTFFIKKIKEKYSARNPKTGELIYVPEKNKVRFKSSKKLIEFINK